MNGIEPPSLRYGAPGGERSEKGEVGGASCGRGG
jgi:hypothetical protein